MREHLIKTMSDSKVNVLLFAAGLGTRLRPATLENPKPVIPLFGIPMGYYLLPYIIEMPVDKFVVNTFHLPEKIHDCYSRLRHGILFSDETDFIKGSGGGLKQAEALLGNKLPVLAGNADEVFFTADSQFLKRALDKHLAEKALATLIVMNHPEAGKKFGGIWTESHSSDKVVAIGKEAPSANARPWHFIGLQILSPEIFTMIEAGKELNIFYDVLIHKLPAHKVQIFPVDMDWYELGNAADYSAAKKEIAAQKESNPVYKKHFTKLNALPQSKLSDLA